MINKKQITREGEMKKNKITGREYCETREELVKRYFHFESSILEYKNNNKGIISLLSDVQEFITFYCESNDVEHYRHLLNDIKSVLMTDDDKRGC